MAGPRQALVKVVVAVIAGEPRPAVALIRAVRVSADAVVAEVVVDGALVDVVGASLAGPAGGAGTFEAVGFVCAAGAILARAAMKLMPVRR